MLNLLREIILVLIPLIKGVILLFNSGITQSFHHKLIINYYLSLKNKYALGVEC